MVLAKYNEDHFINIEMIIFINNNGVYEMSILFKLCLINWWEDYYLHVFFNLFYRNWRFIHIESKDKLMIFNVYFVSINISFCLLLSYFCIVK